MAIPILAILGACFVLAILFWGMPKVIAGVPAPLQWVVWLVVVVVAIVLVLAVLGLGPGISFK